MEQMMKGIPNFYPRGSGIVVTGNFRYTAEMCDCEYCGYYGGKKKGCLVPKCVCLEERISVGIASPLLRREGFVPRHQAHHHKRPYISERDIENIALNNVDENPMEQLKR